MSRLACTLTAALLAAAPLPAQSVAGRVLDNGSDAPVLGVLVELRTERGGDSGSALTDSLGAFRLEVPGPGIFRLRATRIGYQRVESPGFEVGEAEQVEADLRISASAVLVEPLTITSRPEPPRSRYLETVGFYERERRSSGTFVRRDRVDRANVSRLSDFLSDLPGVRKVVVRGVSMITLNRQWACPPQVMLDGHPLVESIRIDDIISLRAIEALEIYRGPSETPAEYGYRERGCGMVVIWTRDRI